MPYSTHGRFRCIHCGDRFDLDPEQMELYDEGFFISEPDTCDDCINCPSAGECYEFSDADPGM